ncbi:uncharacterized protein RSE6_12616 [Rhynchosporium secalis]|uniref:Pre-mRNA-splicing factor n=1 Tax=Rhynchosporium secalis TaxID=38038 RepID=A0A1E1MQX2_RHYSE|nr:uncharacterized protein RSE6_12616 [Rhynchosporium secalis]
MPTASRGTPSPVNNRPLAYTQYLRGHLTPRYDTTSGKELFRIYSTPDKFTTMSPSKDAPPSAGPPKLGMKGFSLSAKVSSAKSVANPKPGSGSKGVLPSTNMGKRPRTTFQRDSDSDDERRNERRHEAVTGFGDEGVERKRDESGNGRRGELVIKGMKNRDWRGEMAAKNRGFGAGERRGKDLLPAEERARRDAGVVEKRDTTEEQGAGDGSKREGVDVVNGNDEAITWGLTVRKRARTEDENSGEAELEVKEEEKKTSSPSRAQQEEQSTKPQTADEEALASLLGAQTSDSKPILTIPAAAAQPPLSEQETYRLAVLSAPDPSTLDDYERIPVEEFGAALLRGMGWKGDVGGKEGKKREGGVKRRPNLLGLGAKELDGAEELGAWVQKSDFKRLNPGGGGRSGGRGGGYRRPKAGEYKREKERERERREERGGGGYRREKDRDRREERNGGGRDYRH